MAKIAKNDLGYLGIDFQYSLVSSFINNHKFFIDIYSIIDPQCFTDLYLKGIVATMKEYYLSQEIVPGYKMIETVIREKRAFTEDDLQYYIETLEKLKNQGTEGIDYIEELGEKFFKQQNLVKVANQIRSIAGDGDVEKYDECQKLVEDALAIGKKENLAVSPLDNIDDSLSKENVVTIPTGVSLLDDTLGGGLDKGKVGLIMGSSGFGKTSLTTCFASNAAATRCEANGFEGYKVLQIVFEDSQRDISRKHISKLSQVETCELNRDEETTEYVKAAIKNHADYDFIKNNIRILKLDSGEKTANDIKSEIKKYTNMGFKPDMVIVDYFECLKHDAVSKYQNEYAAEGKTMRKFENMAPELDIAIWITTQGNRDSFSATIVTMDKGKGSLEKQQIAQVVISISRSLEDQTNQRATIAVLKNRSGKLGATLNGIIFNNGTCTVTCDEVVQFDDALVYNEEAEKRETNEQREMVQSLRAKYHKE